MKRSIYLKMCRMTAAVVLTSTAGGTVWAQDTALPDDQVAGQHADSAQIEDIVVMAQRRSERLQDVPIAASAFSGETLRKLGATRSDDIAASVPNLIVSGAFDTIPKITLRGIGTNDYTPNVNPAVGTYVDEVYIGLVTAQRFSLYDVQRVEVLRGPQGTLYGKNTTGGAINYYTNRPETAGFAASLTGGYGNFDTWDAEGFINAPLSDSVAMRVSGLYHDGDGYASNAYLGSDQGAARTWAARAQLRYNSSSDLDINLSVHGGETRADLLYSKPVGLFGGVDIGGFADRPDPYVSSRGTATYDNVDNLGGNLNAKLQIDPALSISSITGYEYVRRDAYGDNDNGPRRLLESRFLSKSQLFSQELRLNGEFERLNFVIGGQYYREYLDVLNRTSLVPCIDQGTCPDVDAALLQNFGIPGFILSVNYDAPYIQRNKSYAAFGQMTYHLTDRINLTLGGRYTNERRSLVGSSTPDQPAFIAPFPGYPETRRKVAAQNFSYKATVDYRPVDGVLLYGTYATGFKAPNFNGFPYQTVGQLEPVKAEKLKSGEIGFKLSVLGRTLQINGAAFYNKYDNLQVFSTENLTTFLRNAASATIKGGELEFVSVPLEGLRLAAGMGYTDATYDRFDAGLTMTGQPISYAGNRLPFSPKTTLTGSIQYEPRLTGRLRGLVAINAHYQSKTYFSASNADTLGLDRQSQSGYTILDGRVGVRTDHWSIALWSKNLFDKAAKIDGSLIGFPFGFDLLTYNKPRTFGVTGSMDF